MRKKLAIAIGLAVVAVLALWLWSRSVVQEVGGGQKVWVAVAAEDIPVGARVSRTAVAFREVPDSYVHPETVRKGEEAQIVNRTVSEKIAQGQPFLWSNFDQLRSAGSRRLAGSITKGQRALTLPVDLSGSLAGMLRPGDHVDILGTFSKNQGTEFATVTLLQNIAVLATGEQRGETSDPGEAAAGGGHTITSITVSVDLEEAELLVFSMQRGPINIALRATDDLETMEQVPEKNFGDIFEAPKRANFARRHAAKILPLKAPE
jgi:pilus assembly protein CpaB